VQKFYYDVYIRTIFEVLRSNFAPTLDVKLTLLLINLTRTLSFKVVKYRKVRYFTLFSIIFLLLPNQVNRTRNIPKYFRKIFFRNYLQCPFLTRQKLRLQSLRNQFKVTRKNEMRWLSKLLTCTRSVWCYSSSRRPLRLLRPLDRCRRRCHVSSLLNHC